MSTISVEPFSSFATDTAGIAKVLGVSPALVAKDRRTDRIIPFFTIGRAVRYDIHTVRQVMLARQQGPNAGGRPRKAVTASMGA